ncbi:hypothetical protein CMQ_3267 [Grosmannia clavigera kw1407]|uniref:Uncharacterized protein n=1 Tax=Grosmannia clavigera (strain kw1407 / UAMH 11150) TaxID=655863 RepID=F0X8R3_GROCL|nr:uncharacterized protein CMQ_3267 [Grosmannia clavigera kw1407]EFX05198.1 hypothetical protein CMQ_3267 [Grosmannia clavigera kw1407]
MDSYHYVYRNDLATDGNGNEDWGYYPDSQWYQYKPTRRGGQSRRLRRREARLQAEAEAEAEAAYAQTQEAGGSNPYYGYEAPFQQDSGARWELDPNASIFTPPKQHCPGVVDATSGQPQQAPAADSSASFPKAKETSVSGEGSKPQEVDVAVGPSVNIGGKDVRFLVRAGALLDDVEAYIEEIGLGLENTERTLARVKLSLEKVGVSFEHNKTPKEVGVAQEVQAVEEAKVAEEAAISKDVVLFAEEASVESKTPLANATPEEVPVQSDALIEKGDEDGEQSLPTPARSEQVRITKAPAVAVPVIPKTAGAKSTVKPTVSQANALARPAVVRPAKESSLKSAARPLPAKPVRATLSRATAPKPAAKPAASVPVGKPSTKTATQSAVPKSTRTRSLDRATGPRATSRGRTVAERGRPSEATRRASSPAARSSFVTRLAESLARSSRTASPRPALRLRGTGIPSEPTIKEEPKTPAVVAAVGGNTAAGALDALKGPLLNTTTETGRGRTLRRRRTDVDAERKPNLKWPSKRSQSAVDEKKPWL